MACVQDAKPAKRSRKTQPGVVKDTEISVSASFEPETNAEIVTTETPDLDIDQLFAAAKLAKGLKAQKQKLKVLLVVY